MGSIFLLLPALLAVGCLNIGLALAQDSTSTTTSAATSTSLASSNNVDNTVTSNLTTLAGSAASSSTGSGGGGSTTAMSNEITTTTSTTPSASQNQVSKITLKPPMNRKAGSKGEKQKPTKPYPKADLSSAAAAATTTTSTSNSGSQDAPPTLSITKTNKSAGNNNNIAGTTTNAAANLHACGPNPNSHVVINELRVRRIDFIELYGEPGTNLDGLYVLSVYHNGTVRVAIPLDGNAIPEDGYFFLSEHNDIVNGEAPDLVVPVFGANSRRHSTILLVCNYQGLPFGEVLDVDGDCQFDSQPWDKILDSVGLANARKGECTYSPTVLDSASSRCFCHIYREPDQVGDFVPNPTSPFGRDSPLDSPGRPNMSAKKQ